MEDQHHHAILFKDELIRRIQELRKTRTSRIVTMHNSLIDGTGTGIRAHWPHLQLERAWVDPGPSPGGNPGPYLKIPCQRPDYCDDVVHRVYPRVQAGDLLWVKEAWRTYGAGHVEFRADYTCGGGGVPWRSPLHLRKADARLWLLVKSVMAQRIQEIDAYDAKAEGCEAFPGSSGKECSWEKGVVDQLRCLWDEINGHRPNCNWEANPLVWAYDFEITERPEL